MPIYPFRNPETGQIKDVFLHMTEEKEYIEDGVQWERVFTVPCSNIDTQYQLWDQGDFIRKTENKKGKLGELFDLSNELSQKREEKEGADPIKEKYFKEYSQKRNNKVTHPEERKREFEKLADKCGMEVEWD